MDSHVDTRPFTPVADKPFEILSQIPPTESDILKQRTAIAALGHHAADSFNTTILPHLSPDMPNAEKEALHDHMTTWEEHERRTFLDAILTFQDNKSYPQALRTYLRQINGFANHDIYIVQQAVMGVLAYPDDVPADTHRYLDQTFAKWIPIVIESTAREIEDKPHLEQFNPIEPMQQIIDIFRIYIPPEHHINITFLINGTPSKDTDPTNDLALYGDPLYFQRSIYNVIRNAQKKLSARPTHDADAATITVSLTKTDAGTSLAIQDSGEGFPADLLAVDTDPEDHIKKQRALMRGVKGKGKTAGQGLGLAILDRKMREHFHGSIAIQNDADNQNPTVTLHFPPPAQAQQDEVMKKLERASGHIPPVL